MFDVFTHAEEQESVSQQTSFVQKTVLRKGDNPGGDGGCNSHNRSQTEGLRMNWPNYFVHEHGSYLLPLLKHLVPASLQERRK